jgi:hypothetical protein
VYNEVETPLHPGARDVWLMRPGTWVTPAGVSSVQVSCWGGGGGGSYAAEPRFDPFHGGGSANFSGVVVGVGGSGRVYHFAAGAGGGGGAGGSIPGAAGSNDGTGSSNVRRP